MILPENFNSSAASALLAWFAEHGVRYPWGDAPEPWGVWVSEVMLQQTTVVAVESRYRRWMNRFPSPEALAGADEKEVLREWEGLGYYNRARNLAAAAAEVVSVYAGRIPGTSAELRKLPGVGEYIASAVASFAFGERAAAIDANGRRIAQRLSARSDWDRALETEFRERVEGLMPRENPGLMNAALMQLGQLVCTSRNPACGLCPLADCCLARASGRQGEIPPSRRRDIVRMETDLALLVKRNLQGNSTVLVCRKQKGAGRGLWVFPGVDDTPGLDDSWTRIAGLKKTVHTYTRYRELLRPWVYRPLSSPDRQELPEDSIPENSVRVTPEELNRLPMPSAYRRIAADLMARKDLLDRQRR